MKIYLDTSKINEIFDAYENNKLVQGFTTNPSLMRAAGVTDYTAFIKEVTSKIKDLPLSFEIFADEPDEMEYQIQKLSEFGDNIYVKVPVMNTKGIPTYDLIHKMSNKGIKLNVTAVFTASQIAELYSNLHSSKTPNIVSIFAGRLADTGMNPILPIISCKLMEWSNTDILWASVREVFNIYEAEHVGCDIITVPPDILKKYISLKDKDLTEFSWETCCMFYNDAVSSKLSL